MDIESLIGWTANLFFFAVLFYILHKRQSRKGKESRRVSPKLLVFVLCFHVNLILSLPLAVLIVEAFDISTDGFMNLNGLMALLATWSVTVLLVMLVARAMKRRLSPYGKTIQVTQAVFFLLPFFLIVVFFLF